MFVLLTSTSCSMGLLGGFEVERKVPEDRLVVSYVEEFLRRKVLVFESDALPRGIYSPSAIFRLANDRCSSTTGAKALLKSIENGDVASYVQKKIAQPPSLGELNPASISFLEHADDRRQAQFSCGAFRCEMTPITLERPAPCIANDEPKVSEQVSLENFRLYDLDYVVLLTPTVCCLETMPTIDVAVYKAQRSKVQREAFLAAATYSDNAEYLLRLMSRRHSKDDDKSLGLPTHLKSFFEKSFDTLIAFVKSYIENEKLSTPNITFDRNDIKLNSVVDYGAWFQALADSDSRTVYISPLLALSPFYFCYNKGAFQYAYSIYLVEFDDYRYDEIEKNKILKSHKKLDDQYRDCVNSELFFVFGHEIFHILSPNSPGGAAELAADCFAFFATRKYSKAGFGVMQSLILNSVDKSTKPETIERLKARRDALEGLEIDFRNNKIPGSGKEALGYCSAKYANTN